MDHFQGERSEDHFRIHQRIWDDLPANEYSRGYIAGKPRSQILSVNWYDMSIRENERLRAQFIGQSYVQSSFADSTKDGGSSFRQRLSQLHLDRKQQNKIPVLPEFLHHVIVLSSHSRTHRRNDLT